MTFLVDGQLPPALARWLEREFGQSATTVKRQGLGEADDLEIYRWASRPGYVVATKDDDLRIIQDRLGPPPQLLIVACGNCSNPALKAACIDQLPLLIERLESGEPIVELR